MILIFHAGRAGRGVPRGPRGPKHLPPLCYDGQYIFMRGNDFAHLAVNRKSQQEVVRRDCWGMEVWAIYGKEMGAHRDEDIVHILTPRIHLSVSYYYSYSRSWYPPTHYPQANISTNWGPGQFLCTTLAQLRTVLLTISESGVPEAAQKLSQIEKNPHQQLDTSCAFFASMVPDGFYYEQIICYCQWIQIFALVPSLQIILPERRTKCALGKLSGSLPGRKFQPN